MFRGSWVWALKSSNYCTPRLKHHLNRNISKVIPENVLGPGQFDPELTVGPWGPNVHFFKADNWAPDSPFFEGGQLGPGVQLSRAQNA